MTNDCEAAAMDTQWLKRAATGPQNWSTRHLHPRCGIGPDAHEGGGGFVLGTRAKLEEVTSESFHRSYPGVHAADQIRIKSSNPTAIHSLSSPASNISNPIQPVLNTSPKIINIIIISSSSISSSVVVIIIIIIIQYHHRHHH